MFDKLKDLTDLQNLKEKVEDIAESHGDKITQGLEKAGEFVDDKTSGKYSEQIDTGVDKAQDLVERLGEGKSAG
ncbi:antitoxin [Streptomyces sp. 549]|uniref:antitoxin n=1 Tax=Streptomyces sp. 549 TaxID=3049076 RepID=UPI0024C3FEBC|nr:antitoxin [Streptomyces sp. 549]MDK1473150.1 antitoxin [Streptomyces sp. 549]